jgi:hypothetical protein
MIDVAAIFLAWLERTKMRVRVVVADTGPNHVKFSTEGWDCLQGSLSHCGINIYAMRGGECWDIIWDSNISPKELTFRRRSSKTVGDAACVLTPGRKNCS